MKSQYPLNISDNSLNGWGFLIYKQGSLEKFSSTPTITCKNPYNGGGV